MRKSTTKTHHLETRRMKREMKRKRRTKRKRRMISVERWSNNHHSMGVEQKWLAWTNVTFYPRLIKEEDEDDLNDREGDDDDEDEGEQNGESIQLRCSQFYQLFYFFCFVCFCICIHVKNVFAFVYIFIVRIVTLHDLGSCSTSFDLINYCCKATFSPGFLNVPHAHSCAFSP